MDVILVDYGNLTARQLSHLTHSEAPWRDARAGLGPTDRSSRPISLDSLVDYYGALDAADNVTPVDELDWSDWERPESV